VSKSNFSLKSASHHNPMPSLLRLNITPVCVVFIRCDSLYILSLCFSIFRTRYWSMSPLVVILNLRANSLTLYLIFDYYLQPICNHLCISPRLCLVHNIGMGLISIVYIPTTMVLDAGICYTIDLLVSVHILSSGVGAHGFSLSYVC